MIQEYPAGKGQQMRSGKRQSKEKIGFSGTAAALALLVFIMTGAVCLVLNLRPLYYADIRLMKIPEYSGLSAEAVRENYDVLIDYNQVWNRNELAFPSLPMSQSGKIHFEEVKRIFDWIQIACLVSGLCLVFLIPLMLLFRKRRWLFVTGILALLLPAAAGILVLVDWERFFVTFHQLVFRNDFWLFDPAVDPVITILPDGYFEQCAVLIVVIVLLAGVLCLRLSRRKS